MGKARELLVEALAPLGGFSRHGAGLVAEHLWADHKEKRHNAYLRGERVVIPRSFEVAYGARWGNPLLLLRGIRGLSRGWASDDRDGCYPLIGRVLARRGHLGLLRLGHSRGLPLAEVYRGAVLGGHLNVLRWARLRGCAPADGAARRSPTEVGFAAVVNWARVAGCDDTSLELGQHIWILWWAFRNDYMDADLTAVVAAQGGHLALLRWAYRDGCPLDSWVCAAAAAGGHLAALRWARSVECPWNAWTCAYAALGGELEVLQWARANACPWDRWTCAYATLRSRRELLRWAHANGCPCACPR